MKKVIGAKVQATIWKLVVGAMLSLAMFYFGFMMVLGFTNVDIGGNIVAEFVVLLVSISASIYLVRNSMNISLKFLALLIGSILVVCASWAGLSSIHQIIVSHFMFVPMIIVIGVMIYKMIVWLNVKSYSDH